MITYKKMSWCSQWKHLPLRRVVVDGVHDHCAFKHTLSLIHLGDSFRYTPSFVTRAWFQPAPFQISSMSILSRAMKPISKPTITTPPPSPLPSFAAPSVPPPPPPPLPPFTVDPSLAMELDDASSVSFPVLPRPSKLDIRFSLPRTFAHVEQPEDPKVLSVAVIGPANAGKSSLMNQLVGEKVSHVSSRAQTTRSRILGVSTMENVQVIFSDTPGVVPIQFQSKVSRDVIVTPWTTLPATDHLMVVLDSAKLAFRNYRLGPVENFLFRRLLEYYPQLYPSKTTLVLNKIDLLPNFAPFHADTKTAFSSSSSMSDLVSSSLMPEPIPDGENQLHLDPTVPLLPLLIPSSMFTFSSTSSKIKTTAEKEEEKEEEEEEEEEEKEHAKTATPKEDAMTMEYQKKLDEVFAPLFRSSLLSDIPRIMYTSCVSSSTLSSSALSSTSHVSRSFRKEFHDFFQPFAVSKEHVYPSNVSMDMSVLEQVNGVIRQYYYEKVYGYLAYSVEQRTISIEEKETPLPTGSIQIVHEVSVERPGQEKIVVGKLGQVVKYVEQKSSQELAEKWGKPVYVSIHVRVKKNR